MRIIHTYISSINCTKPSSHYSCCKATEAQLPSCTNPFPLEFIYTSGDFCPSPPLVSSTDAISRNTSGRLDSDSTYIQEFLLRDADRGDITADWLRQWQAGFVITVTREPALSICGCTNTNVTCNVYNLLEPSDDVNTTCPYYLFHYSILNGSSNQVCPNTNLPGCYTVDGFSGDVAEYVSCPAKLPGSNRTFDASIDDLANTTDCGEDDERPISGVFPDQNDHVTVTVWYNNQV